MIYFFIYYDTACNLRSTQIWDGLTQLTKFVFAIVIPNKSHPILYLFLSVLYFKPKIGQSDELYSARCLTLGSSLSLTYRNRRKKALRLIPVFKWHEIIVNAGWKWPTPVKFDVLRLFNFHSEIVCPVLGYFRFARFEWTVPVHL